MAQQLTFKNSLCAICGLVGRVQKLKTLPGNATIMQAIHLDGNKHEWTEYDQIKDMSTTVQKQRQKSKPKLAIPDKTTARYIPKNKPILICGICGKEGFKYKSYIQHSANTPPTGPQIVNGKFQGWNWVKHKLIEKRTPKAKPKQTRFKKPRHSIFSDETLMHVELAIASANRDREKHDPNSKPYIHAIFARVR
jgi:hypothetical protein